MTNSVNQCKYNISSQLHHDVCSSLPTDIHSSTDQIHHHQLLKSELKRFFFFANYKLLVLFCFRFLVQQICFLDKTGCLLTALHVTTQNCRSKPVSAVKEELTIKKEKRKVLDEILTPCKTWKLSPQGCWSWSGSTPTLKHREKERKKER